MKLAEIVQTGAGYLPFMSGSLVISCIIIAQRPNQDLALEQCMCMVSRYFITCVNSCSHHYNQDQRGLRNHKGLLPALFPL